MTPRRNSSSRSRLVAGDVLDRHDQRRVAGDPRLAVDDRRQLGERLHAVLRAALGDVRLERASRPWRPSTSPACVTSRDEVVDVDPRVPEVEVPHRGERPDALPVRPADLAVDRRPLLVVEAAVAAGDGEARDEPLDVPLERAGERLVEVVEAEDDPPVGRGEAAEVRQVRVAAELGVEPRPGPAREIRGHQVGGAAVERERRDEHAAVADRDELGHARLRLLLEQLDRVGPVRGRLPVGVRGARHLGARGLAARGALGDREVLDAGARRLRRASPRRRGRPRLCLRPFPSSDPRRSSSSVNPSPS